MSSSPRRAQSVEQLDRTLGLLPPIMRCVSNSKTTSSGNREPLRNLPLDVSRPFSFLYILTVTDLFHGLFATMHLDDDQS